MRASWKNMLVKIAASSTTAKQTENTPKSDGLSSLAKTTRPRNAISAPLPFSKALQSTERAAVRRSSDTSDPCCKHAPQILVSSGAQVPSRSGSKPPDAIRRRARSVASPCGQDDRDGLEDDHDVPADRPVLHIGAVERHPAVVSRVVAAADLPGTGQPGADLKVEMGVRAVHRDLVDDDRSRADDAHVAAQHVDQLGKLVQAELAQHRPDDRDARIVLELARRDPFALRIGASLQVATKHLVAIGNHGAELQAMERLPSVSDPRVAIENGAPIADRDRDCHQKEERREHDQRRQSYEYVDAAFGCAAQRARLPSVPSKRPSPRDRQYQLARLVGAKS